VNADHQAALLLDLLDHARHERVELRLLKVPRKALLNGVEQVAAFGCLARGPAHFRHAGARLYGS
jgi:hypothetical protein